jgi:MerR family transcriptional regulator, heat shock protein HspR
MNYYSIAAIANELGVHDSSIRRWEERELIFPERVNMGRTSARIFSEDDLRILRRAKQLMDDGMELRAAFQAAYNDFAQQEEYDEKQ